MSHVSLAAAEQVHAERTKLKGVRLWLAFVAALIVAMVLVGGATRLTESGLSIVEWKPVTGALPPMTDKAWHDAFDAYKTIPQYHQMNRGMSLDEFKMIFWWEWSHRLLGRVIGAAFLLPFLYFIWRGGLSKDLKRRLWIIFAMGGVQGAVGWWMVASGLSERVEVSQYRLAAHLILALLIYSAIVWTLLELSTRRALQSVLQPRLKAIAAVFVGLVFVQIYFGALVAGLRAGRIYNTWPLIDGAFIPPAARLLFETPWWRNFFDNTLTVQFTHRMVAYALGVFALWQLFETIRAKAERGVTNGAWWIVGAIFLQATLGILTLVHETPIDLALTHQAVAVLVLTLALAQVHRLRSPELRPEPRISGLATSVSAE